MTLKSRHEHRRGCRRTPTTGPAILAIVSALLVLASPRLVTAQTPQLVKDIIPGPGSSSPLSLTAAGGKVYFAPVDDGTGEYRNLWFSDGTEDGTSRVLWITDFDGAVRLFEAGGILYFVAHDEINGHDLWKSHPWSGYTAPVQDISPDSYYGQFTTPLIEYQDYLVFNADDGQTGIEPWYSDGTSASQIDDIRTETGIGSSPAWPAVFNGFLYFNAQTTAHGAELFYSGLTSTSTFEIADIWTGPTGSSPRYLTAAGGFLFFSAATADSGRELWKMSDGGVVSQVKDILPGSEGSDPSGLTAVGDTLFFFAEDDVNGRELWKSNGEAAGTVMVKDIYSGANSSVFDSGGMPPGTWAGTDELFFFVANDGINGDEVWVSDGTGAGTQMVRDIYPGSAGNIDPAHFVTIGARLYFRAEDQGGTGLWVSDGTEQNTVELTDGVLGGLSNPSGLVNVNGDLFFTAYQASTGTELWMIPLHVFKDGFESGNTSQWSSK